MTAGKTQPNRCVQLTDAGLTRLHTARRKYRKTIDDIAGDDNTPSMNTVKRALRQGPVFLDTLERLWDYLRGCAEAKKETLTDLVRDQDYVFVEEKLEAVQNKAGTIIPVTETLLARQGWISRQTPRPNRLFMGRHETLNELHAALKAGPTALIPDAQALTGLGGIGKTQTAIAYLYQHRHDYNGVFWVYAETLAALNDGLASLAEELKLPAVAATKQAALQQIQEWFQANTDWLLVLDNADDLDLLAPHFPRYHTGSLLLTTRAQNTTRWANPVRIAKFDRDTGALLLLRCAGVLNLSQTLADAPRSTVHTARELSDEMDGLPLALDQAGACLAESGMNPAQYLAQYRERGLDLLDQYPSRDHKSVTITYRLALEQMAKRSLYGSAATELVYLSAFLAPDAIPEAIFTAQYHLSNDKPDGAALTAADPAGITEAMAAGCRYSLLHQDTRNQTVAVHHLVQKVVRDTLSAEQRRAWRKGAVRAVADATPDFEFDDWPLCDLLLPHWRLCAETIREDRLETAQAAYLVYQAGRYLRARAAYEEAEPLLQLSVEIAEKAHGTVHSATAEYQDALACLYRDLNRYDEAESLHLRALKTCELVSGPDHTETAGKLHNLALLYMERQEYAKAEACFLRTLVIRERQPEQETMLLAAVLTQLAGVYRYQKRYEEAEPYSRRALHLYDTVSKPNHIDVASACNNLALLCISLNRLDEAESLCRRAIAINESARGKEHPETGTAQWSLAMVLWKQKRMVEADAAFQCAIRIYHCSFDAGHPKLARLLGYYADFQREREPA